MAFTVTLFGGSPWGFRIQKDKSEVIRVSRINPGSKASLQGLKEGDVIEAINDKSTAKLSQNETYDLIRESEDKIKLTVKRDEPALPRMFKSSKSIELNGTNHNSRESPRFQEESGKTNSVPSSPISITLSSSKKGFRDKYIRRKIHPAGNWPSPRLPVPGSTTVHAASVALRDQVTQQVTEQCIAQLRQACCDVWKVLSPAKATAIADATSFGKSCSSPPSHFFATLPPPPGFRDNSFEEPWSFKSGEGVSPTPQRYTLRHEGRRPSLSLHLGNAEPNRECSLSPRRYGGGSVPCSPRSPDDSWWEEGEGKRRGSAGSQVSDPEWREKIRKFAATVQTSICSPLQESVPLPGSTESTVTSSRGQHLPVTVSISTELVDDQVNTDLPGHVLVERDGSGSLKPLSAQSSSESTTLTDAGGHKLERGVFLTTSDDTDAAIFEAQRRLLIHRLQVPSASTKTDSRQSSTETTSDALSDRLLDFTAGGVPAMMQSVDSRQSSTEVTSEASTDIMPRSESSETRSRTASLESQSSCTSDSISPRDSKSDSSTLVTLGEKLEEEEEEADVDTEGIPCSRPLPPELISTLRALMLDSKIADGFLQPPSMQDLSCNGSDKKVVEDDVEPEEDTCTLDTTTIEEQTVVCVEGVVGEENGQDDKGNGRKLLIKADSWDLISENLSEELSQLIASLGESICTKPLDLGKSSSVEDEQQNEEINSIVQNEEGQDKIAHQNCTSMQEEEGRVNGSVSFNVKKTREEAVGSPIETTNSESQTDDLERPVSRIRRDASVQEENSNHSSCSSGYSDDVDAVRAAVKAHEMSGADAATQTDESSVSNRALRHRPRTTQSGVAPDLTDASLQTDESETLDDLASLKSDEVASLPSEGARTPLPIEEEDEEQNEEEEAEDAAEGTVVKGEGEASTDRLLTTTATTTEPTLTDVTELPSAYLHVNNQLSGQKSREDEDEDATDTLVLADIGDGALSTDTIVMSIGVATGGSSSSRTLKVVAVEEGRPEGSGQDGHLSASHFVNGGLSDCEFADASENVNKVVSQVQSGGKGKLTKSESQFIWVETEVLDRPLPSAPPLLELSPPPPPPPVDDPAWNELSSAFKYAYLGIVPSNGGQREEVDESFDSMSSSKSKKRLKSQQSLWEDEGLKLNCFAKEDGSTQWSPQEEFKEFVDKKGFEDKETQSDADESYADGVCPKCQKVELTDKSVQTEDDKVVTCADKTTQVVDRSKRKVIVRTPTVEQRDKGIQAEVVVAEVDKTQLDDTKKLTKRSVGSTVSKKDLKLLNLEDPYHLRRYTLPRTARTHMLEEWENRKTGCQDECVDVDFEGTHSLMEFEARSPMTQTNNANNLTSTNISCSPSTSSYPKSRFPATCAANPRTRALLVEELMGRGAVSDGEEWTRSTPQRRRPHQQLLPINQWIV